MPGTVSPFSLTTSGTSSFGRPIRLPRSFSLPAPAGARSLVIEQGQRGLHPRAVRHPYLADGRSLDGGEGSPDVVEGFLQALEIREGGEVGAREMRRDRDAQVPRLQRLAARFLGLCLRDAGLPVAVDVDTVAERAVDDARYQRGQCVAVPPAGAIRHVVAAVRLAGGGMEVEGLVGQDGVFVVGHAVQVLAGDIFRVDADHEIKGVEQAHSRRQRLFQAEAMLLEGRRHDPRLSSRRRARRAHGPSGWRSATSSRRLARSRGRSRGNRHHRARRRSRRQNSRAWRAQWWRRPWCCGACRAARRRGSWLRRPAHPRRPAARAVCRW